MTNSVTNENLEGELNVIKSEIEKAHFEYRSKIRFLNRKRDEIENQIRLCAGIPEEFKEYFDYFMFSQRDNVDGLLLEAREYKFESKEALLSFLKAKRKIFNTIAFYSYNVRQYEIIDHFDENIRAFVCKNVTSHNIRLAFTQKQ